MTALDFTLPKNCLPAGSSRSAKRFWQRWLFGEWRSERREIGKTEAGDPQLYLLGPAPDYDCILCVSRLGGLYVLEDGNGKILFEHRHLMLLSQQVRAAVCRKKMMIAAKAALIWATIRQTMEERIGPLLEEQIELASHLGPQIAALA